MTEHIQKTFEFQGQGLALATLSVPMPPTVNTPYLTMKNDPELGASGVKSSVESAQSKPPEFVA